MDSELDRIAEKLEKQVWEQFSETVFDHAKNPRNFGVIKGEDGHATVTGQCGDKIQIWLKLSNDLISEISFWTNGCGTSIASGSMVTELAKGKSVDKALQITPLDVLKALGGLPEEDVHCAFLAVNTLHEAIKNCLEAGKDGK
ncbi:iron-sulfur cluster assembly scaffold protein [Desulfolucanica intricata]|uniref:iron-sulfur cluster assembly scaffold protein n=1 Tax=Desulfolucanica intricata TaxID=1285191 RepID=UPI00082C09F1|nr:iron-sulfur cluster assembly scaffold protein [Desulfolucanica intricata]